MTKRYNCFKCSGKVYSSQCGGGSYISRKGHDMCYWYEIATNDLAKYNEGKSNFTLKIMLKEYLQEFLPKKDKK